MIKVFLWLFYCPNQSVASKNTSFLFFFLMTKISFNQSKKIPVLQTTFIPQDKLASDNSQSTIEYDEMEMIARTRLNHSTQSSLS
ncbi:hypothetical protein BY996DRAFT_6949748 [Phakopsora pachyrhizi]|nr:hypothetical protein BY996DRAFT_6949748 [Phakopsora pachyrhizi]